ncbi:MAG: transcription initiation factor IIB, partial [Promethearchaeota archaeon]
MYNRRKKPYDEDEEEKCCPNPSIISNEDGLRVCQNCGMTFGQAYADSERRAYTAEEVSNRRRTEPKWRSFGPRTVITGVGTDARGHHLEARKQALFSRLSKIQGSLVSSLERNFWEAKPKLNALSLKLSVPSQIVETAWKIYSEVARQKLTMGRSIDGFTTASLYAAIRIHDFPRLLEEVVEVAMIPLRSVHRSLGLIVRNVFPVLHMKYKPVTTKSLVYRFGSELKLEMKTQTDAANILEKTRRKGLKSMGKDPKGLAAGAIYMACKNSN